MDHPEVFAELPFELAEGEFEGRFEGEFGRRGGGARSRPAARRNPMSRAARPPRPKPPRPRPRPRPRPLPAAWPPYGGGYAWPVVVEPGGIAASADQQRCMQACLTRGPGAAAAPEPAAAGQDAPDAADGAAAPPDEPPAGGDAAGPPEGEFEFEFESESDTPADCRLINLTAQSDRSLRKGTRDPKGVYALVLHQMACCFRRRDPLRSYLRIKAHFAILPEGQILQLHPVSALLWASHGFNSKSVAVEFAGNFPDVRGRWWKGETYGRNRPTPAQLEAGRCLVRHLVRTMGLRVVLAHRQSSDQRENDPGPEVWYHVGQWAVDSLRLSDGGSGFKIGSGKPIPDAWRTWGRTAGATPELELAGEDEFEGEFEGEYEGEYEAEGEAEFEVAPGLMTLAAAIADPRSAGPGVYTLYKNGERLYVGRANTLRRRLQQHLWCLTHLKLGAARFHVRLTPMRGATPTQLGRVEAAVIDRYGRSGQGGQLANVKARELEQELWGEA